MKKIVVLISGSGSNLEAIINACESKKIYGQVIYVISNNPDAYGLERAKRHNINTKIIHNKLF
jgi:phosphoribosylglycinamide formyltransferase-1